MDNYKINSYNSLEDSGNIPNVFGYSIERGDTNYKSTLEERIQAARAASNLKHAQKQKNTHKLFLTNNRSIAVEKNTNYQNSNQDFKTKYKQRSRQSSFSTDLNLSTDIPSLKSTYNNYKNLNSQIKPNNAFKPTYKEGGSMQSRLEAIKAKKYNKFLAEQDNISEVTKFAPNPSKQLSLQKSQKEVPTSNQFSNSVTSSNSSCAGVFKGNPYQTRSVVQKNDIQHSAYNEHCLQKSQKEIPASNLFSYSVPSPSNSSCAGVFMGNAYQTRSIVQKNDIQHSTYNEHCNRTKSITKISNNSVTSVQNRLIKVKEDMKAKSKYSSRNNVLKTGAVENPTFLPPTHVCKEKSKQPYENNALKTGAVEKQHMLPANVCNINKAISGSPHNFKNKTKRLNQPHQTIKNKTHAHFSNVQQLKKIDVPKVMNKKLISIKQQPIVPNSIKSSNTTETVTVASEDKNIKKSKQNMLDSFSFVIPQKFSVQQRLENTKKKQPIDDDDDFMEWEDVIEPRNIVNKVNNLRKSTHEYEPMEWTPDTILNCDLINHCLVIDTNILLSNLNLVAIVIDKFTPEYGYLTIVLPWQVLQELDYFKKQDDALGYRAREAARWLLEMFSKRHPRLKGQPMVPKDQRSNDDLILECAIILKDRVNFVTLVTDDKILNIKSEVNDVAVKNSEWLKNVCLVKNQNESDVFQEAVKKYPNIENNLIMKIEPRLEHIIARVLKLAVVRNQDYTTFTKKSWWKIYSLTLPLNLTKCLIKLKEHWNIISPQKCIKTPTKQLDYLIYFFKELQTSPDISLSWNELFNLVKFSSEIMYALPYEYYDITDVLLNDLMKSRKFLTHKLVLTTHDGSSFFDDTSLSISMLSNLNVSNNISNIDNSLMDILKEADTFCSYIYNANGFKYGSSKSKLTYSVLNPMYSNEKIQDFAIKLSNLINIMLKIKKCTTDQLLESHIIINEFSKAIVVFDNEHAELNPENVMDYCLMRDKNSFLNTLISLQNYLAQIKNLFNTTK